MGYPSYQKGTLTKLRQQELYLEPIKIVSMSSCRSRGNLSVADERSKENSLPFNQIEPLIGFN